MRFQKVRQNELRFSVFTFVCCCYLQCLDHSLLHSRHRRSINIFELMNMHMII